jgi:hypothetical protein
MSYLLVATGNWQMGNPRLASETQQKNSEERQNGRMRRRDTLWNKTQPDSHSHKMLAKNDFALELVV